ncbi:glutamate dehydrogenase [Sphingomonas lacunae]|uniref:Glutamate dehydrogenase n=1 Tax=Sphingomonas lacunae TaxID=2698828 RepID=A0A6M4ASB8_9SPHN|nr:NAD-glutamate dehydrogenase domain-containing protein [Sphingomonas lacunae]QJQ31978.1 glutamate dehydrogenase [Sphingomonas lacunae]
MSDSAAANNPLNPLARAIESALIDSALPDDELGRTREGWTDAARFMLELAMQREGGQPSVRLETVSGSAGSRRMRLGIVNDDMPFLVDSVAGAVAAAGLTVDSIIHPVVAVRRDAEGKLIELLGRDASGERRESLIYMEIERADARVRRDLVTAIDDVLRDVRAAVSDWLKMQAAMQDDASRIGDGEASALLRWFLDRNFTQLGHERHVGKARGQDALGICRTEGPPLLADATIDAALGWFAGGGRVPLMVKSNRISSVHRRVLIDLIILPIHGEGGVAGLSVHAGLWTSAALSTPPERVPLLRTALAELMQKFGFDPAGHAGKALAHVLTQLPHDLLVAADSAQLESLALAAMSIADRPRPKLHLLEAPLQRHLFAFVWLPRDEVSTSRRLAIQSLLIERAKAKLLGWSVAMEDGGAALLRYTLDLRDGGVVPDLDELDRELEAMVRGWAPGIEEALAALGDEGRATALAHRFAPLFPQAYRINHAPEEAARDILSLRELNEQQQIRVRLIPCTDADGPFRLKVYSSKGPLALSRVVPALENFGFTVIEEQPTALTDGHSHIHDFLLGSATGNPSPFGDATREAIAEQAIAAVLSMAAENDAFNQLVISADLDPDAVVWLRAAFRYLRQAGVTYGLATFVQALRGAPVVTRALMALFIARHDPQRRSAKEAEVAHAAIMAGLDQVAAIDDDRILRLILAFIEATVRTNAFAPAASEALAFKLDSARVPGLPKPLPWREIFVYSPRVEGIHLRAGPVARGGLRWSDRRDDFRTEILGLMKAQRVKNAVIVPTGAKGGFYPKQLPDPATDRDAWLAEGTECYRIFIRTLLSITDNLSGDTVVHPADVTVLDGEDPYFVVAADKGTATFSDVANALALERDFWLGDAFASGGSNGYDHKAMGITARGAWLSVQRHFLEMGVNVQADPVTVVGVGDMSGDVFGNGMLLSRSIRLVAAFDHRHIFIDPDPDAAASWQERSRLFNLPRSSWADYDPQLISTGGGVFPRSQKSIPLSAEAQAALGIQADSMEPLALMSAILQAPADLLWFGGIGTYVKAAAQNNAEVGDPANDRLRVNAEALRVKVVGEGANLGITQAARIAFAARGGRINTDFIDNSAGVDCSDNEVNIKIALNTEVREGRLAEDSRNLLLAGMTDDVAELVLADNRLQALALSIAERGGAQALPTMIRLIEQFEADGRLDRTVEGLAANDELMRRAQEQRGLTRPELAVILSTAKLTVQDAAEERQIGMDPLMEDELLAAFPPAMVSAHRDAIVAHKLRNEIVATKVANRMINRMGVIHPFELAEEEGVGIGDVVEAFVVAEKLLNIPALWAAIDSADMAEATRLNLFGEVAVELRAHMADLIRHGVAERSMAACVADLSPGVAALDKASDSLLRPEGLEQARSFAARLIAAGAPADLADRIVHLAEIDGSIGIVALSRVIGAEPVALTEAFTTLGHATGLDWAQGIAMQMAPSDPWERLLVAGLGRDFQQIRLDLIGRLGGDPVAAMADWLARNGGRVQQFRTFIERARANPNPSPAMLAQLAGQARTLLARM